MKCAECNNIQGITFKQLIDAFSFRMFNEQTYAESDRYDTKVVRFDFGKLDYQWSEYCLYDLGADTWDIVKKH